MPLIRGHHYFDDQFTQIPNEWLRDTRLSLKAIGLLAQIMSHSPGWNMSIRSLAKANQVGTDTIKSAVVELEQHGYLTRSDKQKQNEDGTFADYDWVTTDPSRNPVTVKPRHGETGHKEEQFIKEQQLNRTNASSKSDRSTELFPEFWTEYPLKKDKGHAFKAFKSALRRAKFEDILAGAIAYRNDPTRKPEFTKYPATWLNADAWENAAVLPEVKAANEERMRREREATKRYLDEQRERQQESASGPALCKHGLNLARCVPCLKELS